MAIADEPDIAPAKREARIRSLDYIRGIAVMGIVFANIIGFGQTLTAYVWPAAFIADDGDPGGWLWIAQFVAVDGKFRGLFTVLFGAGLMLFMTKAWASGATRWLQLRRLAILLVFGMAHYFLIWRGDILIGYAIIGMIALLFVHMTGRGQLLLGLIGYLGGAILYAGMFVPLSFIADTDFGRTPAMADMRADLLVTVETTMIDERAEIERIRAGDYAAYIRNNWSEHRWEPIGNVALFIFETLPFMLIGMGLYRIGFFGGAIDDRTLDRWGWTGIAVGVGLSLPIALWVKAGGFTFYGTFAAMVGLLPIPQLAMTMGLAALLVRHTPVAAGWFARRVIAAGRAAFTNYLGTSIVMIALFHGWGGGLFGELNRPQLYGLALGMCALMLMWSAPWLDRFRYGPLEWVWRCLTYARLFPFRR
ncbi:MAG: DUF418 domain-containing protein [Pontixanthobacter sp.]